VRRDALQALGRIGGAQDEELLRALVRLLAEERETPLVVTSVTAALERITGHTTCGRSVPCWNSFIEDLGLPEEE